MKNKIRKMVVKWLTKEPPAADFPLCDFERLRYELRPCDVVLVEGRSRISEVIKLITQTAWSHAALYIGRLHDIESETLRQHIKQHFDIEKYPDAQLLIEGMLGKGIIISPLVDYKNDHLRICRPKGLSPSDGQKVIEYSISQLGYDYNVRQIFDLARFMLPWGILPRRWRSSLFNSKSSATENVCSTMLAEAFGSVNFPILPLLKKHNKTGMELIERNPKLLTPRDFDYSPYFEIIKYPFVEVSEPALYRKLPWNREGLVSNVGEEVMSTPTSEKEPALSVQNAIDKADSIPTANIASKQAIIKDKKDDSSNIGKHT